VINYPQLLVLARFYGMTMSDLVGGRRDRWNGSDPMTQHPGSRREAPVNHLIAVADATLVEAAQVLRGVADSLSDEGVDCVCDAVLRIQERCDELLEILEARQPSSTLPDIASGDL
jgi:hypothetical protein